MVLISFVPAMARDVGKFSIFREFAILRKLFAKSHYSYTSRTIDAIVSKFCTWSHLDLGYNFCYLSFDPSLTVSPLGGSNGQTIANFDREIASP